MLLLLKLLVIICWCVKEHDRTGTEPVHGSFQNVFPDHTEGGQFQLTGCILKSSGYFLYPEEETLLVFRLCQILVQHRKSRTRACRAANQRREEMRSRAVTGEESARANRTIYYRYYSLIHPLRALTTLVLYFNSSIISLYIYIYI